MVRVQDDSDTRRGAESSLAGRKTTQREHREHQCRRTWMNATYFTCVFL